MNKKFFLAAVFVNLIWVSTSSSAAISECSGFGAIEGITSQQQLTVVVAEQTSLPLNLNGEGTFKIFPTPQYDGKFSCQKISASTFGCGMKGNGVFTCMISCTSPNSKASLGGQGCQDYTCISCEKN